MMVKILLNDDNLTALVSGEIDHHSSREIREQIDKEIEFNKSKKLIIDFKDVTFMDSSGIGLIMGRYKLMKSFDGDVFIANCSFQMKKVMKLAGLDKLAEFI
ncbi:MAG: anti-sigma factor antagonist [Oscillospiraceae bacterium]